MRPLAFALLASVLACTETYHPEYHPVTVTTVHQAYGGSSPAPAPTLVVEQPRLADPAVVLHEP